MKLSPDNLLELSQCAIEAAEKAGALIESYASKNVDVQHKEGGNTVASQVFTEVDVLAEKAIVEVLAPTCTSYDLALLTEESVDDRSRFDKDYFWCVDPMDGTLSFIESKPGYAVSIALVSRSGEPVIGVVYDPATHTLYEATKGQGLTRNGQEWNDIAASSSLTGQPLTLVCDRGFTETGFYPAVVAAMDKIACRHGFAGITTLEKNGAVLNACFVLEHSPAVYFKFPKPQQGGGSVWDFAATAAIFSESGFIATDFYGQALDLNRANSTFMNHQGVLFATDPSLAKGIQALLELTR